MLLVLNYLIFPNKIIDPIRPKTEFAVFPASSSSDLEFRFRSTKKGSIFEYYMLNALEMLTVRNWTKSMDVLNYLSWLDGGEHQLRVRSIDPAGNIDEFYIDEQNMYTWIYIPALPWGLIIGLIVAFVIISIGVVLEWRKRRKRAAMERYAMKRMRRKLKGAQKGGNKDVDWRKDYDDAKDGKKKKKKSKKKEEKNKGGKKKGKKKLKKNDGKEKKKSDLKSKKKKDKKEKAKSKVKPTDAKKKSKKKKKKE